MSSTVSGQRAIDVAELRFLGRWPNPADLAFPTTAFLRHPEVAGRGDRP